jgi:hypothetical protein
MVLIGNSTWSLIATDFILTELVKQMASSLPAFGAIGEKEYRR